ncbi:MAG: hypothetical protein HGA54_08890 [Actinobacteria bacterium]|nr:hypothetical protein [Actinomycetota bacterium]
MKTMTRRVFFGNALIGAALIAVSNPLSAFAVPTSAEKQAEADAVQEKLDAMLEDFELAVDDYNGCVEAHDIAVAGMEEAQGRIDAAEEKISSLQAHLSTRVTVMYREGSPSFIDVLCNSKSFSDFITTWDVMNDLNQDDADYVEQMKVARIEAQAARDEYAALEHEAAVQLTAAEEAKVLVEGKLAAYQAELDSLEADIAQLIAEEKAAEEREAEKKRGYTNKPVPNPITGNAIVDAAYTQLGVPYVWGGSSPGVGLDCSGLTQYCYRQAGIDIPRGSGEQRYSAAMELSVSDAEPGDILWKSGHVGIYIGDGAFIHAPQDNDFVRVSASMGIWTCALRY